MTELREQVQTLQKNLDDEKQIREEAQLQLVLLRAEIAVSKQQVTTFILDNKVYKTQSHVAVVVFPWL